MTKHLKRTGSAACRARRSAGAAMEHARRAAVRGQCAVAAAADRMRGGDRFGEDGFGIVEGILILVLLVVIVIFVFHVLGGSAKNAANNTANCINNPTAAGC